MPHSNLTKPQFRALFLSEIPSLAKTLSINQIIQNKNASWHNAEIKKLILEEGHKSRLNLHPDMTKIYQDLKETFWWQGVKKDVA